MNAGKIDISEQDGKYTVTIIDRNGVDTIKMPWEIWIKQGFDPDRLNREHVHNVRGKDGKFVVVVVTDKDKNDTWEISWDKYVREGKDSFSW